MSHRLPLLPSLPPSDGEVRPTSLACPDCAGTLFVHVHGAHITFSCWIGHTYSLSELLASKEDALERRLWIACSSLEEMAMLIEDLEEQGFALPDPDGYRSRAAIARSQAEKIRSAINGDRRVRLPESEDPGASDDQR